MKLKRSLSWALAPICISSTIAASTMLWSCGNDKNDDKFSIFCDDPIILVDQHVAQFTFTLKNCPSSSVNIKLLNDISEKLSLQETTFSIKDGHIKIEVKIDESVTLTQLFSFDVEASYQSTDDKITSSIVYDLGVLYTNEPDDKDLVVPISKSAQIDSSRKISYDILFTKEPQSDVLCEITKDDSRALVLEFDTIHALKYGNFYSAKISLFVGDLPAQISWLLFDVEFSFKNHYGIIQTSEIKDFLCVLS